MFSEFIKNSGWESRWLYLIALILSYALLSIILKISTVFKSDFSNYRSGIKVTNGTDDLGILLRFSRILIGKVAYFAKCNSLGFSKCIRCKSVAIRTESASNCNFL